MREHARTHFTSVIALYFEYCEIRVPGVGLKAGKKVCEDPFKNTTFSALCRFSDMIEQ